jgi:hypothetical protein
MLVVNYAEVNITELRLHNTDIQAIQQNSRFIVEGCNLLLITTDVSGAEKLSSGLHPFKFHSCPIQDPFGKMLNTS